MRCVRGKSGNIKLTLQNISSLKKYKDTIQNSHTKMQSEILTASPKKKIVTGKREENRCCEKKNGEIEEKSRQRN